MSKPENRRRGRADFERLLTIFGRKPLRSLAELPAGACLYLNHPLFRVRALGGLLSLPPARVRELDLSDNALHDVGTALSHYQSLTELRLAGNAIESIELSHMPRLLLLDLHPTPPPHSTP